MSILLAKWPWYIEKLSNHIGRGSYLRHAALSFVPASQLWYVRVLYWHQAGACEGMFSTVSGSLRYSVWGGKGARGMTFNPSSWVIFREALPTSTIRHWMLLLIAQLNGASTQKPRTEGGGEKMTNSAALGASASEYANIHRRDLAWHECNSQFPPWRFNKLQHNRYYY